MLHSLASVEGALAAAPATVFQAAILASAVTGDARILLFALLLWAMGSINDVLKTAAASVAPHATRRPDLAKAATGACRYYPGRNPPPGFSPVGMPSGHAQAVGFAAAWWLTVLLLRRQDGEDNHDALVASAVVLPAAALAVGWSRVHFACHTWAQVWAGLAVGAGFGVGLVFAMRPYLVPKRP